MTKEKNRCPSCGDENVYFPLMGPPECPNYQCENYSEKQFDIVKEEQNKNDKQLGLFPGVDEIPLYKNLDPYPQNPFYDDDDGDILYATGYSTLPYIPPISTGPHSSPSPTLPSIHDIMKPYAAPIHANPAPLKPKK